jgi:asparagine synthase (glutamine-hydrolysing)
MSGFLGLVTPDRAAGPRWAARMASELRGRSTLGLRARTSGDAQLVQGHGRAGGAADVRMLPGPGVELLAVGDVRLGGRDELRRALRSGGADPAPDDDDLTLVLRAYRLWGTGCPVRLEGDFAFAIWDPQRMTVFAARDPLGVKPLFYASVGDQFVFGNTLAALLLHPGLEDLPDDHFIGDFLIFFQCFHAERTAYAAVSRLPGGHALQRTVDGTIRVDRFWSPPSGEVVERSDVQEEFESLLLQCVGDALPPAGVGILMSGGVDSTLLAAVSAELAGPESVRAHIVGYRRLFEDPEWKPARASAAHIGIPLDEFAADDFDILDGIEAEAAPEPALVPFPALSRAFHERVAAHAGVAMTGYDGDAALAYDFDVHLYQRLRRGEFRVLRREIGWLLAQRPVARVGMRTSLRRRLRPDLSGYPQDLEPSFERAMALRDRWVAVRRMLAGPARTSRESAVRPLRVPIFSNLFEGYDTAWTGVDVAFRHPLADRRLIGWLTSLPPVPYCIDKHLFREAARGRLPDAVRLRPKTSVPVDTLSVRVHSGSSPPAICSDPALQRYLAPSRLPLDSVAPNDLLWRVIVGVRLAGWLGRRAAAI